MMPTYRSKNIKTLSLFTIAGFILLILVQISCKRLVEAPAPVTSTNAQNVYTTDATAIAVLTGIYSNMSSGSGAFFAAGSNSISLLSGLSSDELTLYSGVTNTTSIGYYTNALTNVTGNNFWNSFYPVIFTLNSAIQGVSSSTSLTPAVKQQLLGEAKFMRAFCYFYLVNLYGDIPLATSADYSVNALLPRTPATKVWQQIVSDLKDAQNMLSMKYLDGTLLNNFSERVRPNQFTATALLARAYLYTGDWANAEAQASTVINNSSLYSLRPLDSVFLKASMSNTEAIWQLQPVLSSPTNTLDGVTFIIGSNGPNNVYLSDTLMKSFEPGDQRKNKWTGNVISGGKMYYFPNKYRISDKSAPVTEYTMVLRLAEQYLIRAEARVQLGTNLTGAMSDLNAIRNRTGVSPVSNLSQPAILTAIQHERQVELFTEWGQRWLDLKRTKTLDALMSGPTGICHIKGGQWNTNWQWYPLPLNDLQYDPNLVQNNGY